VITGFAIAYVVLMAAIGGGLAREGLRQRRIHRFLSSGIRALQGKPQDEPQPGPDVVNLDVYRARRARGAS
jgi:hypothetical protein